MAGEVASEHFLASTGNNKWFMAEQRNDGCLMTGCVTLMISY